MTSTVAIGNIPYMGSDKDLHVRCNNDSFAFLDVRHKGVARFSHRGVPYEESLMNVYYM